MNASTKSATPAVAHMSETDWRMHLEGYRRRLGTTEERPPLLAFFHRHICGNCRIPLDDCVCD